MTDDELFIFLPKAFQPVRSREKKGASRPNRVSLELPFAPDTDTMKPQVEDVEDDLAAEEENKLINEVSERVIRHVHGCKAIC